MSSQTSTRSRGARQSEPLLPSAELVTVTPEMAAQWLDTNVQNRPVRDRLVAKLAAAIRRGEWRVNGDTIRFDEDGNLVDGQHRLWAVVVAEMPVQTLVVHGVARSSQITMDTGAKRKFADVLKMRGEVSSTYLASTLRLYWRYENGTLRWNREEPSYEELLTLLEDCPGMRESVLVADRTTSSSMPTSPTVAAVAHFLLAAVDADEAEWFFARLRDGVGLEEDSPVRRLREWLIGKAGSPVKVTQVYELALYVKAWNAWIEGRPVKSLRWRIGGHRPEPFPTISAPDGS